MSKKNFKVLCIDGGGIRGLIPATLLAKIEESLSEPLWKYFDLICGTSTGGIIALAISVGKSMKDIKKLYDEEATNIFPYTSKIKKWSRVLIGTGGSYDSNILEKKFKKEFGTLKIREANTRLCIPSIDITNGKTIVFKTPHEVEFPKKIRFSDDADKEMWEVARATSAAPTFFSTAKIRELYHIDGGLWANNPSAIGVVEAMRCGFKQEEISLLSLGTANEIFQIKQKNAPNMNLFRWGRSGLIELSFEVQSQAAHNEVTFLLLPDRYMRIQYKFKENIRLDDISRLGDLRGAAEYIYKNQGNEIKNKFFTNISNNPSYK
ncbi:MAG: CBASS cGAMP-activated phospholipase [bacterium]|nr:CBASS cGAMP-activated phospholipase [bacterium]